MTLEELGSYLKEQRELKEYTIEDIANYLKIGKRLIHALEEGDTSSLPHMAYTKGFIRSYATYLGVASDEIIESIRNIGNVETPQQNLPYSADTPLQSSNTNWIKILIIIFILAGCGYAFFAFDIPSFFNKQNKRIAQPISEPEPEIKNQITQNTQTNTNGKDTNNKINAQNEQNDKLNDQQQKNTDSQNQQQQNQKTQTQQIQQTQQSEGEKEQPTEQKTNEPKDTDQHKIIITAKAECWIHSTADNTETRQFSLRKGETFALTFKKNLVLRLGNAGGVSIRYNGEDMPAPGQMGQVRTLTFPPTDQ